MDAVPAPRAQRLRLPRPRRLLARLGDDRLVELARSGDESAFAVLFDRHVPGLLAFAKQLLGSLEDAEDVVQHAMAAAHRELADGSRELRIKPWLYTVVHNRSLSLLRSGRGEIPLESAPEPAVAGISEQVAQREDLRAVLADLARLPEGQRSALVLAEVSALSQREIAEILGVEASQVKSLIFQARSALIADRRARDTDCAEIREQLSTLTGGALRRRELREHLRVCAGCRDFRDEVRGQRAALALVLPILPSDALREAVLGSVGIGGGAAVAAAAGGGSSAAIKVAATVAVAGTLAGGTVVATERADRPPDKGRAGQGAPGAADSSNQLETSASSVDREAGSGPAARSENRERGRSRDSEARRGDKRPGSAEAGQRREKGAARENSRTAGPAAAPTPQSTRGGDNRQGFTPTLGESNGAAAKEFSATRGNGNSSSADVQGRSPRAESRPAPGSSGGGGSSKRARPSSGAGGGESASRAKSNSKPKTEAHSDPPGDGKPERVSGS